MHPLAYPMAALAILSSVVLLIMLYQRVSAVKNKQMDFRFFKTYNYGTPPAYVVQSSRNYSNLFEMPVLFYAGCLLAITQELQSPTLLALAWGYVATRAVHSAIHLGPNKITPRLLAFAFSNIILTIFWIALFF